MSFSSLRLRRARDKALARSYTVRKAIFEHLGTNGINFLVDCGDHRIALDPADRAIAREILEKRSWQRPDFDFGLAALSRFERSIGSHFVDVGANIGTQTIYALLSGRFSRAVAIEPDPKNFDLLNTNIRINDLVEVTNTIQSAAGEADGLLTLYKDPYNSGGHSLVRRSSELAVEVPVASIDSIVSGLGIGPQQVGLLWVDVEGYEREVISGMQGLLSSAPPLALEFNGAIYGKVGSKEFIEVLSKSYRGFIPLRGRQLELLPLERLPEPGSMDALLFPRYE